MSSFEEILSFYKDRDMTMLRYDRVAYDAFLHKRSFSPKFPFVHIAGSNGKSSVAHYLSAIYRKAGYKVGSFIKPFGASPLLMVRINGEAVGEDLYERAFSEFEKDFRSSALSIFEMETILAYRIFEMEKVDIAIVECGMGGSLDSTNIPSMKPLLSIITSISLEHTEFLGRTIGEIARSKAGIIKEGSEVLIGELEDTAKKVIQEKARKENASFHEVESYHNEKRVDPNIVFDYRPYKGLCLFSNALYELKDVALAIEAAKILRLSFPFKEEDIRLALLSKPLPCRLERFKNIYLDGAHNPEAIKALMESIYFLADPRPLHVLFASYRDKNIAVELPFLGKEAAGITLTTFDHPRARGEMDYWLYAADYPYEADWKAALNDFLTRFPQERILVTGSLEFAYRVRDYLKNVLSYE